MGLTSRYLLQLYKGIYADSMQQSNTARDDDRYK